MSDISESEKKKWKSKTIARVIGYIASVVIALIGGIFAGKNIDIYFRIGDTYVITSPRELASSYIEKASDNEKLASENESLNEELLVLNNTVFAIYDEHNELKNVKGSD